MSSFEQIKGASAVLRSGGVFREVNLYTKNKQVYAGYRGGYIKILKYQNSTSHPKVQWDQLNVNFDLCFDELGVLLIKE